MRHALTLARRGLGRTAPNPAVGCVIVQGGHIVGRGWTQPGGRPHAETLALAQAGDAAKGGVAYVTLEPCSHQGETPPCARALIDAGLSRVVCAFQDPDPRVNGRGLTMLRDAGIAVSSGVLAAQAQALNLGFIRNRVDGRPMTTLKLATSLDGRIATAGGESQWITGPLARRFGHLLRAGHDAILIGSGAARADDPLLTCRIEGLENRSPLRVVMDTRLGLPLTGQLAAGAGGAPLTIFCAPEAAAARRRALEEIGAVIVETETDAAGQPAVAAVLASLAASGVTRLLIEGGARVAASFLRADLVDEIALFRAPFAIGGDGLAGIAGFGLEALADGHRFKPAPGRQLGDDVLETYRRMA